MGTPSSVIGPVPRQREHRELKASEQGSGITRHALLRFQDMNDLHGEAQPGGSRSATEHVNPWFFQRCSES